MNQSNENANNPAPAKEADETDEKSYYSEGEESEYYDEEEQKSKSRSMAIGQESKRSARKDQPQLQQR